MMYAVLPAAMPGSSDGWAGHTLRYVVRGTRVVAGGELARVTLQAGAVDWSGTAYIGHVPSAPAHPWDVEAPMPLTSTGSTTLTCSAGGTMVCSAPMTIVAGRDLVVSVAFAGSSSIARDNAPDPSSYGLYFKGGASEAGEPSPPGYTTGTPDRELVVSIEVTPQPAQASAPTGGPLEIVTSRMLARPASYDCLAGPPPALPPYTPHPYWITAVATHERRQEPLYYLGGSIAVFGDSGLEACATTDWSPWCENYSINGETLPWLINRLPRYASLRRARAVVVMHGINDIGVDSPDMELIKARGVALVDWLSGPLVWIAVTPTAVPAWRTNIDAYNAHVKARLATRANAVVVDVNAQLSDGAGLLRPDYRIDTEHLSAAGQAILARAVRAALGKLP